MVSADLALPDQECPQLAVGFDQLRVFGQCSLGQDAAQLTPAEREQPQILGMVKAH